jgi:hypothetical protein
MVMLLFPDIISYLDGGKHIDLSLLILITFREVLIVMQDFVEYFLYTFRTSDYTVSNIVI